MHSHVLPGIDDGCASVSESLESIRVLIEHGYVGTICTPHCWPNIYPGNTPTHIKMWVQDLEQEIKSAGLGYRLWPGGELRIFPEAIAWMQSHGVPALADSRYVLCDFWETRWEKWIDQTFDWLFEQGYTPILAHPERSPTKKDYEKHLDRWADRGLLLQGNLQCFTGEAGYRPDQFVRQYMGEQRYTFLAIDMHRPDSLQGRLDGIGVAGAEYGPQVIEAMLDTRVREHIFNSPQ